jgi:hypothetical protein
MPSAAVFWLIQAEVAEAGNVVSLALVGAPRLPLAELGEVIDRLAPLERGGGRIEQLLEDGRCLRRFAQLFERARLVPEDGGATVGGRPGMLFAARQLRRRLFPRFARLLLLTQRIESRADPRELTPESDIDLLVSFAPDVQWGIFEHVEMEQELSDLAGRKVDLISRRAMEQSQNPIRRKAILDNATPLYVAR